MAVDILKLAPAFHYKSSLRYGLSILIGFIGNVAANILGWAQQYNSVFSVPSSVRHPEFISGSLVNI